MLARLRELAAQVAGGTLGTADRQLLQNAYDRIASTLDLAGVGVPAIELAGRDVGDPSTIIVLDDAAWQVASPLARTAAARSDNAAPPGLRIADSMQAREVALRTRDRLLLDRQAGCRALAAADPHRILDLIADRGSAAG